MPRSTTPGGPGPGHSGADRSETNGPPYDPLLAFEAILEQSELNVTIFDQECRVRDASSSAVG